MGRGFRLSVLAKGDVFLTNRENDMAMKDYGGIMRDLDAEAIAYAHRWKQVALAAESLRVDEIYRVCARYELESDEFYTREEKAQRIISGWKRR